MNALPLRLAPVLAAVLALAASLAGNAACAPRSAPDGGAVRDMDGGAPGETDPERSASASLAAPETNGPSAARMAPAPPPERTPLAVAARPAPAAATVIGQIAFRDTPLQDAIRILADRGGLNVVFDPESLRGKTVTTELRNVSAESALSAILRVHGLAAARSGPGQLMVGSRR